ncbi:two-component system, OmpR family, response regulator/two-component system, OmpR family, response regulator QseB [Pseudovibrio denitrificans]|uniref:Two-component system, OmpR family, response regulator/two-component system, OmpR family, response regulator QseB n=1 Tax=Pseudovibrio denitrificans TaxID=258256 RepID=A0A1I6XPD8_9HYPH|nr:response regulator transcription factor [Pseudovibrio denitrificans]SFT39962.1 two-component system, OmpR family, response regulator/two-component system, OmpR family, response regulator QseB [Pseudovibrio denitrificans]
MRVLLVEDERLIADAIKAFLERHEFIVDWVDDGLLAEDALRTGEFDLVILDLGLPGQDGLEFLRAVRDDKADVPILILSARETTKNRIDGLNLGADDYLTKPFDMEELLARCRALVRRSVGRTRMLLQHGALTLDLDQKKACYNGAEVVLQPLAFRLLTILLERRGRVVSKSDLMEKLYGWEENAESNVLEVYVSQIRRKTTSKLIRTIRGVGYIVDEDIPA